MKQAKRVLFMGSKSLGFRVLREMHKLSPETLVGALTIDDSDDTRSAREVIEQFSRDNGISLYSARDQAHAEEILREIKPDLCMVAGWYWMISPNALRAVPRGYIGIHNSLLPKYRGGSPLVWSIINNEKQVGFSFFTLGDGMDEGDIWIQQTSTLQEDDTIYDATLRLEDLAIAALRENYKAITSGNIIPSRQNHANATYCAMRMPCDGNIDWEKSASDVYNFIRAQSDPYPGAFTFLKNSKVIVWKAERPDGIYYGTPGQVARVCANGVFVICGDNRAVLLKEAQIDDLRGDAKALLKSGEHRLSRSVL